MLLFPECSLRTQNLRAVPVEYALAIVASAAESGKERGTGSKEAAWDLLLLERVSLAFPTLGLVTEIAPDRGQVAEH